MPLLQILIASTRPGRAGLPVATWFHQFAVANGRFECELVDLAEVNLPPMDEPNHPVRRNYQHEHTKAWSARVERADAYVFVTPEYNYGPAPALVNALDYVFHEWSYKPVAFVSYGGISGGTRAVQVVKSIVTTLKMMPIPESVIIPFVAQFISPERVFTPQEAQVKGATAMLEELRRWSDALAPMRARH